MQRDTVLRYLPTCVVCMVGGNFEGVKFTLHMYTHTHTCRGSQQMNTCWSTALHWGVGGGRGVSAGGITQLRLLNVLESLSS
jgi:hypothetical protein